MKRILASLLVSIVLVCLSIFPSAAGVQANGQGNGQMQRIVRLHRPGTARSERHPKMHAAVVALEGAKAELEHADIDFGGHKKDALESVDNALKQLRLALQFEKY